MRESRLFVDHVAYTVVVQADGGIRPTARRQGGLARWQEQLAKDILSSNLDRDIPLQAIAAECGLSPSHFARAFRISTGSAPHQWLLHLSIEAAKAVLLESDHTLAEVALACGFSDQSHFTRVFTRLVGASPGAWRLSVVSGNA
ncbi:AraC-like DNA-binding protein [Mesorhizobium soli]|uniref:AraC family transcriptional regulator n=1 Tax=Pseudaminobacter soli (ex Li et al. 2025) TaxID=1295366 RepID=UPI002475BDDD|nr:AraC family transcriptional regulator [Mesorhizobium soli]MDH6230505.1 AraC-like DNA-binding protein [Mesorhizobium soli]